MSRLVVVDAQRIFAAGPWGSPMFDRALPVMQRLVDTSTDTVFTRFVAPEEPTGSWVEYYRQWPFARQPPSAPDYGLVDAFAGAPTLDATTFGKWPVLSAALTCQPGDEFTVCGVSTDCCVIATVLPMADAGMRVTVVADACAGLDEASHRRALDVLALFTPQVRVLTAAELDG